MPHRTSRLLRNRIESMHQDVFYVMRAGLFVFISNNKCGTVAGGRLHLVPVTRSTARVKSSNSVSSLDIFANHLIFAKLFGKVLAWSQFI